MNVRQPYQSRHKIKLVVKDDKGSGVQTIIAHYDGPEEIESESVVRLSWCPNSHKPRVRFWTGIHNDQSWEQQIFESIILPIISEYADKEIDRRIALQTSRNDFKSGLIDKTDKIGSYTA